MDFFTRLEKLIQSDGNLSLIVPSCHCSGADRAGLEICVQGSEGVSEHAETLEPLGYCLPLSRAARGQERAENCERGLHELTLEYCWQELVQATEGFARSRVLGSGRMSTVYRGWAEDGVDIAVKVLNENIGSGLDEEVRQLSRCHHPNVVMLVGFAKDAYQHRQAIAYELLPGGSVFSKLQNSTDVPFQWQDRVRTAIEASRGFAHLHKLRPEVFHRDIKSSNILFSALGVAKIADFGLVSTSKNREERKSQVILASVAPHSAPEYIQSGIATERSEVFSMGIVLIELLTARAADELARIRQSLLSHHENTDSRPDVATPPFLMSAMDTRAKWPLPTGTKFGELATCCCHVSDFRRPCFLEMVTLLQDVALNPMSCRSVKDSIVSGDGLAEIAGEGFFKKDLFRSVVSEGPRETPEKSKPTLPSWIMPSAADIYIPESTIGEVRLTSRALCKEAVTPLVSAFAIPVALGPEDAARDTAKATCDQDCQNRDQGVALHVTAPAPDVSSTLLSSRSGAQGGSGTANADTSNSATMSQRERRLDSERSQSVLTAAESDSEVQVDSATGHSSMEARPSASIAPPSAGETSHPTDNDEPPTEDSNEGVDPDARGEVKGWLLALMRKGDPNGEPAADIKGKAEAWLQSMSSEPGTDLKSKAEVWLQSWRAAETQGAVDADGDAAAPVNEEETLVKKSKRKKSKRKASEQSATLGQKDDSGGNPQPELAPTDESTVGTNDEVKEAIPGEVKGWLQSWGWKRPASASDLVASPSGALEESIADPLDVAPVTLGTSWVNWAPNVLAAKKESADALQSVTTDPKLPDTTASAIEDALEGEPIWGPERAAMGKLFHISEMCEE